MIQTEILHAQPQTSRAFETSCKKVHAANTATSVLSEMKEEM